MPAENDFKKLVDGVDYVAFDVYDTAVVRPFRRPTDLFRYMEGATGREGFAESRIEAEKRARRKLRKEVTLDEIYSFLPGEFKDLKNEEIQTEISLTRADRKFVLANDYARRRGKKILMVSDMYFPRNVIAEVLTKLNIDYDYLYVSNDCWRTKHDGSMYDYILEDRGIASPHRLLMVGDNRRSDYEMPKRKGISVYRWIPLTERYGREYPAECRYGKRGIDESVLMGTDMLMWQDGLEGGYWDRLGRSYGGPMALQFALHIADCAESADRILFLSRDAYNVWKVYDRFCGNLGKKPVPSAYIHISRMLVKALAYKGDGDRDSLESVFEYLRRTGEAKKLGIPAVSESWEHGRIFRERKTDVLSKTAEAEKRYGRYLKSRTEGCENILLVDTTTMRFTTQRFLTDRIPGITGCYYAVTGKSNLPHTAYCNRSEDRLTYSLVNFAEYCFSSGEPPICDIDANGEPVYSESSWQEMSHTEQADRMLGGELQYCDFVCGLYGEPPKLSGKAVDGWCELLFSRERRGNDPGRLSGAVWAVNTQHTEFLHVVLRGSDLAKIVKMKAGSLLWKVRRPYWRQ